MPGASAAIRSSPSRSLKSSKKTSRFFRARHCREFVAYLLVGAQHAAPLLGKAQDPASTEVVRYSRNNSLSAVILSEAKDHIQCMLQRQP